MWPQAQSATGLKWQKTDVHKLRTAWPHARRLLDPEGQEYTTLQEALGRGQVEFLEEEWESFGVFALSEDHFVKVRAGVRGHEYYHPTPSAFREQMSTPHQLQVKSLVHRGIKEERTEEVDVDDDVFFDFLLALKRHLRTSEPNKTIGRTDAWDNMKRLLRCVWAMFVGLMVFGFTVLIFMTISSAGLVGFDQGDSAPFVVSVAANNKVTIANRVAGRDADGQDIADVCQGFLKAVAQTFALGQTSASLAPALKYVLDNVEFSTHDHIKDLANEGWLYNKTRSPFVVNKTLEGSKQRGELAWGGKWGWRTAVDRLWPSQKVVNWLTYGYNRHLSRYSPMRISGYDTPKPSAILQVDGYAAAYWAADDEQNPDFLEGAILDFLLTRCPIGENYKQFKSRTWGEESEARRDMWARLGVFPRDCHLSSSSGLTVQQACDRGDVTEEVCKSVECCNWNAKAARCQVGDVEEPDSLCLSPDVLHACKVPAPTAAASATPASGSCSAKQFVDGDRDEWLADNFARILYNWQCVQSESGASVAGQTMATRSSAGDAAGQGCFDLTLLSGAPFRDSLGHSCGNYTVEWCLGRRKEASEGGAVHQPPSIFAVADGSGSVDASQACCVCQGTWVEQRGDRRAWDDLSDPEVEAAIGLGYDQTLWDSDDAPLRQNFVCDIRLVLLVDNYLEMTMQFVGTSGFSIVQMMCTVVMVWTSMGEIQVPLSHSITCSGMNGVFYYRMRSLLNAELNARLDLLPENAFYSKKRNAFYSKKEDVFYSKKRGELDACHALLPVVVMLFLDIECVLLS